MCIQLCVCVQHHAIRIKVHTKRNKREFAFLSVVCLRSALRNTHQGTHKMQTSVHLQFHQLCVYVQHHAIRIKVHTKRNKCEFAFLSIVCLHSALRNTHQGTHKMQTSVRLQFHQLCESLFSITQYASRYIQNVTSVSLHFRQLCVFVHHYAMSCLGFPKSTTAIGRFLTHKFVFFILYFLSVFTY